MKNIFVVIPVYNCEKYIERCLKSIFKQSYQQFTIICINDGSTDTTKNILKNIKSNKLIILDKINGGVSSARNFGLDYIKQNYNCTDCYITFIDGDDYIESDYFEKLVNDLEKNKCDISCSSFSFQFEKKCKGYIQTNEEKVFSNFDATNKLISDTSIQSHSHCKLYKMSLWDDVRFPLGVASMEDQATIFKTFAKAKNGVYISNYFGYHYWQEGSSACRSSLSNKKIFDSLFGYLEVYKYDFSMFSDIENKILKASALNAFSNVYLMLFPFFNKKSASNDDILIFKNIKKFVKKERAIFKFKPSNKVERYKKWSYILLRPFYKSMYKIYKRL